MRLISILFPAAPSTRASVGLLVLRVLAGGAMMSHGWRKIQNPFGWMSGPDAAPAVFQALAAIAEFFGGLGLVVGALSVVASFGIACTMVVAIQTHVSKGDAFGRYELAALFLAITVLFMASGPGRFSVDELLGRKLRAPTDPAAP